MQNVFFFLRGGGLREIIPRNQSPSLSNEKGKKKKVFQCIEEKEIRKRKSNRVQHEVGFSVIIYLFFWGQSEWGMMMI